MDTDNKQQRATAGFVAISVLYFAGFLQGISLVSFPASGAILKSALHFSDAQYGAIFLPQVVLALFGALLGAALAPRVAPGRLLWIALLGNAVSQFALASSLWMSPSWQFTTILVATAALGFGFGLSGAPLNSLPPRFFPRHHHTAVVALHTLLGLGLAVGPLVVGALMAVEKWLWFPFVLGSVCILTAAVVARLPLPGAEQSGDTSISPRTPLSVPAFWIFATVTVLYAFAEGTFSNWVVIYLSEAKQLDVGVGTLALSIFWAALVAGRLLISILVLRVRADHIWLGLPLLMIAAFLLLPYADTASKGITAFALAGLACSAFFPLTITLAARHFPQHVAAVSSMMIAALMVGVGVGSFIIGPLRTEFSLETLYQLSALYPALVWVLALGLSSTTRRRVLGASV